LEYKLFVFLDHQKYLNSSQRSMGIIKRTFILLALNVWVIQCVAQDRTVPGKIVTPYPTLENISIEWMITGDDNENGVVKVRFRKKGDNTWRTGMDLRRIPAGENRADLNLDRKPDGYKGFTWHNKHSGSIFRLQPGTNYEIQLKLTDPDGGDSEKTIVVRTRKNPGENMKVKIVGIKSGSYDTLKTISGTPQQPVLYRCENGEASFRFIDLRNKKWVIIEGVKIHNDADEGIAIDMTGAENSAVQHCNIKAEFGIVAYKKGMTNCYVADNVIEGKYKWDEQMIGAGANTSGEGVQFTGAGNVVCYNTVRGFRDCISFMEDEYAYNQYSNDIYNNDLFSGVDDGIEADFCFSNCRIYSNRITNCYVGLSSQPGLGGPTYFFRNVMYNIVHSGFKLKRFSSGDVVLHNTLVKIGVGLGGNSKMDRAFFRNNLAFGGPTHDKEWGGYSSGRPYAADVIEPGEHSSFDYDAVGVFGTPYKAVIGDKSFNEVEKHGIENITFEETFNKVSFPDPPMPDKDIPSLELKPGSVAIDAGVVIPNINDDFKGKAPDCGALEAGSSAPHYGPRNGKNQK
jgi:hypothetical protein